MTSLPADCEKALSEIGQGGRIVVLTGAGVSAESGIPTFRGPEGYWRIGSQNYRPEHLATKAAFARMPWEIWGWYLYRRGVCLAAEPNPAHRALAELDRALGDRLVLVTQNVDGLHLRAGSPAERTWHIHGRIERMRCAAGCSGPRPIPEAIDRDWERGRLPSPNEQQALTCRDCGSPFRPHVLWMDEFYDEPNYRFDSALQAVRRADLLLVGGTSGSTNLPLHMGSLALRQGVPMLVINADDNPFSEALAEGARGWFARGRASELVAQAVVALTGQRRG